MRSKQVVFFNVGFCSSSCLEVPVLSPSVVECVLRVRRWSKPFSPNGFWVVTFYHSNINPNWCRWMERWVDRSITSTGIDLHSCSGSLDTSGDHRIGSQKGKIDSKQELHRHQWLKVSNCQKWLEESQNSQNFCVLRELIWLTIK